MTRSRPSSSRFTTRVPELELLIDRSFFRSEMFFSWWMNQVYIIKNAQAQRPRVGGSVGRLFGLGGNGASQPQVPGFPDDCWSVLY